MSLSNKRGLGSYNVKDLVLDLGYMTRKKITSKENIKQFPH